MPLAQWISLVLINLSETGEGGSQEALLDLLGKKVTVKEGQRAQGPPGLLQVCVLLGGGLVAPTRALCTPQLWCSLPCAKTPSGVSLLPGGAHPRTTTLTCIGRFPARSGSSLERMKSAVCLKAKGFGRSSLGGMEKCLALHPKCCPPKR